MSDNDPQSQENDIISIEALTAMGAEWKYGHAKSLTILKSTMAIVSVISSCCLIRMIMTSKDGFSTTYHRLMLGMSIGDILFSLPIATFGATSPIDVNYMVWNARGNQATCTAKGFIEVFGIYMTLFYSCSLNIYYLFLIKYNKTNNHIRKKIEPFLHSVPISLALIASFAALVNKNYNDGGSGSCALSPIYNPLHCDGYKDGDVREGFTIPCGRGQSETLYFIVGIVATIIPPIVIGVSLGMLYKHVSKQERRMSSYGAGALNTNNSEQSSSDQNRDRSFSRAVLNKAIAYSSSYFLTWVWYIGGAIMRLVGVETLPLPYIYLGAIFGPLEGFFNLLIFMHPKVLAVKKSNGTDNISWPRAFVKTLWSGVVGRDSSQNDKAHATDSKKMKTGQNNKTSTTALSSSNVSAENIESQAPLGSDDIHKNSLTNNAAE
eukprot:scaffold35353_cov39-Cyclotella_meneghiniana.AAC.1